jgi:hypothetical protein
MKLYYLNNIEKMIRQRMDLNNIEKKKQYDKNGV